jgi:hypothetical protein
MQIIYSNPWGFRIHSPFVFRLVTQGLFGKKILLSDKINREWRLNFRQKKKLTRILRLIEFFRTENISITDEACFPGLYLKEILQKGSSTDKNADNRYPETSPRITIVYDTFQPLPEISDEDVWILTDLQHHNNRKQFRNMRLNPKVSISIETHNIGIMIFNSSFQKQHYHIRSWFYLC